MQTGISFRQSFLYLPSCIYIYKAAQARCPQSQEISKVALASFRSAGCSTSCRAAPYVLDRTDERIFFLFGRTYRVTSLLVEKWTLIRNWRFGVVIS